MNRSVTVSGDPAAELVWGTANFNPASFVLNATTANRALTLSNGIDLAGATRIVEVGADAAIIAGGIRTSGGTAGLTKNGSGNLTLLGTNTFNGGLTMNGGNLTIGSAASLGAAGGTLTFNAGSTFIWPNGVLMFSRGMALNNGAIVAMGGGTVGNATFTGAVTGDGGLTPPTGGGGTRLTLSSTGNTFTGPIALGSGIFMSSIEVNSLADSPGAGTITLGSHGGYGAGYFTWGAGSVSALVLNHRQIDLGGAGGGGGWLQNNNASTANTITVNTDLVSTQTGTKGLILAGDNTGNNTFAGRIPDDNGVVKVTKSGAGTWIVSGSNTYSGVTAIHGGILSIPSIGDVGAASSALGAPVDAAGGTIAIGSAGSGGTLRYTGSGHISDRVIDLAGTTGGATLEHAGAGTLKFTSDFTASGAGKKTLTLQGSTAGIGEIAGAIVDHAPANTTSVTKAGTGLWVLSGSNTYGGATAVSAGILRVHGSLPSSGSVTVGGQGTLGGTGSVGSVTVASGGRLDAGGSLDAQPAGRLRVEGALTLNASVLQIDFTNAAGVAGAGWDLLTVGAGSGTVTFNGSPAIIVAPRCANPALPGFDANVAASWRIIDAGSVIGMGSATFTVQMSHFAPSAGGTWALTQDGGDIFLNYSPYPKVDLALSMSQSADLTDVGSAMSYLLTVSNQGPDVSAGIVLSNALGIAVTHVGSTGGGSYLAGGVVRWTFGSLAAGASTTVTLNVLSSLNQGAFTNRALVMMPTLPDTSMANNSTGLVAFAQCPGAPTPKLLTVPPMTVFAFNNLAFSVVASNNACATPFLDMAGKPAGASFTTATNGFTRTGAFSWTPGAAEVGTHPVRFEASNTGSGTNFFNMLIHVAQPGEPTNSQGVPLSQTNWHVSITNILVPSSGNATLVWESVSGITYDIYGTSNTLGAGGTTWTLLDSARASGSLMAASVPAGSVQQFYQIVLAGAPPDSNGVWGIVSPTIHAGVTLFGAPLVGDRALNGVFGGSLAAVLDGDNGGIGDTTGDELYIYQTNATWASFYLDGAGQWRNGSGGSPATAVLSPGQGVLILRFSSSTLPMFNGPVGNTGAGTNTLVGGWNIIAPSEGRALPVQSAFDDTIQGSPAASYDETHADLMAILNPSNGSWKRLQRLPDGYWLDLQTFAPASLNFVPGQGLYYFRQTNAVPMKVRF